MARGTWYCVSLVLLATALSASADSIKVYSTGVNDLGALLAGGASDPHYNIDVTPYSSTPFAAKVVTGDPIGGAWVPNTSTSQWVSSKAPGRPGDLPGSYTYSTSFDLTGLDASTALITGKWASDNNASMYLNGALVSTVGYADFNKLTPFTLSQGFVDGLNVLEFIVVNGATTVNPTALQVQITEAGADAIVAVPTPATVSGVLVLLGACGLRKLIRRR